LQYLNKIAKKYSNKKSFSLCFVDLNNISNINKNSLLLARKV